MQTKTIFHRRNTTLALRCKIMQHNSGGTANTISNTSKFTKMVHPDLFGEDGGRSSNHSDLKKLMIAVSRP